MGLFSKEGGAIPLEGVEIEGEVLGGHARVRVRQKYRNGEAKPIEAVYTFPLPSRATMTAFAMTCDGRRVDGQIREREQAFREYDDAVLAGHGAALMEQERPNVFTASVGNLLPGEETLVDVEYLERLSGDEGALRLMIPTLVAPRYIPGAPVGDRTAHGAADPTDRVPDADRITPPIGEVGYGVKLDLRFDVGRAVEVESPSHRIVASQCEGRTHVSFAESSVPLDRDIVLIASNAADEPLTTAVTHRGSDGKGAFALTVVPDLGGERAGGVRQDVVFVIDHSGSMAGSSLSEAQAALRLCLRHLREGDRFNVIAFDDKFVSYAKKPVPFTQKTLEEADRWVAHLTADGGTEILAPLLAAIKQAPDGIVVLLTDGQVGNEEEILREVMAQRGRARMYPFGIGTNVSDWMLGELAKRTGGALEMIHPGERIDEKVVAQFARAIAPRVTDVSLSFDGLEVGELAPAEPPSLVDGEPWTVFGKLESRGSGRIQVRGKLDGKPFLVEVPVDGSDEAARPTVMKLWASERIRDLEMMAVTGRKKDAMKSRIVALSVENGVLSSYTAFVVVETRTGDRRASGQPETRVVPVNAPAGWDMFKKAQPQHQPLTRGGYLPAGMPMPMAASSSFGAMAGGPPAPPSPSPARARAEKKMAKGGLLRGLLSAFSDGGGGGGGGGDDELLEEQEASKAEYTAPAELDRKDALVAREKSASYGKVDRVLPIMARQLASGLWDEGDSTADDEVRQLRASARALLELCDLGITSTHALHGGPIKKAIEAIVRLAPKVAARDAATAELALGVAWLVSSGRRTRKEIEAAVTACAPVGKLRVWLADERALRGHLDALATA